jgi:hypothetical protein
LADLLEAQDEERDAYDSGLTETVSPGKEKRYALTWLMDFPW